MEGLIKAIEAHSLAYSDEELVEPLLSPNGSTYEYQETTYFDYKNEFPFSLSDDYFEGIVRLICAFNNTYGGVLIFGVHDKKRTGGHNKTQINIEKFNTRLREVLNEPVECVHRKVKSSAGEVDLLLVPKRPMGIPLTRTNRKIGIGAPGVIWLRRSHEVIRAESKDIPFLFGPRDNYVAQQSLVRSSIPNSLPPNPGTIKRFVGRVEILERLFTWLVRDDDPRCFIHGSGGFGKSAVAYEFASILAQTGANLTVYGGHKLDRIIYVSAKQKRLDPLTGTVGNFSGTDFSTADELFKAILSLSQWTNDDDTLAQLNSRALADCISELLNIETQLIVVDDIDTLTTHLRVDAGMDAFYRILARCHSGTKILYTQRTLPSQSIGSSIEVSGLSAVEFEEFVSECALQFKISAPSKEFRDHDLAAATERRPLATEVILGLRRRSGDYPRALELWKREAGSEAREYLYEREYSTLSTDNRARHLLAALAVMKKPATFTDLQNILLFEDEQVSDAVAQVYDMFLVTAENTKGETVYQLGDATKAYIASVSAKLDRFSAITERIRYYEAQTSKKPPAIVALERRCERHLAHGEPDAAWRAISQDHPDQVREHPAFLALLVHVASRQERPPLTDIRKSAKRALSLGYRDQSMMRTWLDTERLAGAALSAGIEICDEVINDTKWEPPVRANFATIKGSLYYFSGRDEIRISSTSGLTYLKQSVLANVLAYEIIFATAESRIEKFEEYARNSAFAYFQCSLKYGDDADPLDTIAELKGRGPLDPLVEPIKYLLRTIGEKLQRKPDPKIHGLMRKMQNQVGDKASYHFHDIAVAGEIREVLTAVLMPEGPA